MQLDEVRPKPKLIRYHPPRQVSAVTQDTCQHMDDCFRWSLHSTKTSATAKIHLTAAHLKWPWNNDDCINHYIRHASQKSEQFNQNRQGAAVQHFIFAFFPHSTGCHNITRCELQTGPTTQAVHNMSWWPIHMHQLSTHSSVCKTFQRCTVKPHLLLLCCDKNNHVVKSSTKLAHMMLKWSLNVLLSTSFAAEEHLCCSFHEWWSEYCHSFLQHESLLSDFMCVMSLKRHACTRAECSTNHTSKHSPAIKTTAHFRKGCMQNTNQYVARHPLHK